ncbi:MAG: CsbD family protein [Streptosporangiaceae bacterium]
MSFLNKVRNRSQIARGRAKQKLGRATGNRRMRMTGVADRIGGNVKQAGEQLKDAGRDMGRSFRR